MTDDNAFGAPLERRTVLGLLILIALTLVSSATLFANRFVQDDIPIILKDKGIASFSLSRIFLEPYWPAPFMRDLYRPFASTLFATEWWMGGGSPLTFRIISATLYVLCVLVCFGLARRLLPLSLAWGITALFAVHPVHVEAVAVGVNQGELIVGLILISTTGWYIGRRQQGPLGWGDQVWIGAAILVGGLFKEHAVVLPALLGLAELTVLRESAPLRDRLLPMWRTALVSAISVGLLMIPRVLLFKGDMKGSFTAEGLVGLNMYERLLTMLKVVPRWVYLIIWPDHLQADYSPQAITAAREFGIEQFSGVLLMGLILWIGFRTMKRYPVVLFGLGFAAITLLPVSNVLVPTGIVLAERTMFTPSVGALLAIAGLAHAVADLWRPGRLATQVVMGAVEILIVLGTYRSITRFQTWHDPMTHANQMLLDAPLSYRSWYALGSIYLEAGRPEEGRAMLERSIKQSPVNTSVYLVLGDSYRISEKCEQAIPVYLAGLAVRDYPHPRAGLVACRMWVGQYAQAKAEAQVGLKGILTDVFTTWIRLADSAMRVHAPPHTMTYPKDSTQVPERAMSQEMQSFVRRWICIHAMLVVWYLTLSLTLEDSALRTLWLPSHLRAALIVEEWAWLMIPAFFIAVPPWWQLRWLLGAATVVFLFGSWGAYETTGRFASLEAVRFFFVVPGQSIEHGQHLSQGFWFRYLLGGAAGGLVLALRAFLSARLAVPIKRATRALLAISLLAGFSWEWRASNSIARSIETIDDLETGVTYPAGAIWRESRAYRSGPASSIFHSIRQRAIPVDTAFRSEPGLHIEYPERLTGTRGQAEPQHHWNVLIIVVESLRRDILFGGQEHHVMPVVESVALTAERFTDSYSTATQTNLAAPVPLSGQYPLRSRMIAPYPRQISWPRVMLHDLLKPLGWRTGIFSSQNEEWWGMNRMLQTPGLDTLFHAQSYPGSTYLPRGDVGFTRFVRKAKKSGKIDDYDTATEAINWLHQDRRTPFMLALNFQDSHLPYSTPKESQRRFGQHAPTFPIFFGRFPEDSVDIVEDEYRNALAYIDVQIGRLRESLIADGRWDSTIVVITGDHGQAFLEHQVAAHANGLWQEQIAVPLIVRVPGLTAAEDARAVSHLDIAPTIADALGLAQEGAWQGISLIGPKPPADRARFFMVQSPLAHQIGVVAGRWKLVMDLEGGASRLTDLSIDRAEHRNVADKEPAVTAHLTAALRAWRHEQLDYYNSTEKQRQSYPPRVSVESVTLAPLRPR